MATTASPTATALVLDLDQDINIVVTLAAGTYLTGGASGWGLSFKVYHPVTGDVVTGLSKTSGGSGIVVTTAGSAVAAAVFTISIADTDIEAADVSKSLAYDWIFKRTDAGNEVNIAAGKVSFRRW